MSLNSSELLYTGCGPLEKLDVETSDCKPEDFFARYVCTRTPVILSDQIKSTNKATPNIGELWSNDYLREKCGSETVRVEYRDVNAPISDSRFGKGQEKMMKFSEFLDSIESGNENLYLTTQELEYDCEGRPALHSPPTSQLLSDIPIPVPLLDTLIISNINIWFGSSTSFVTSGLHHDFHDNLYLVLRGEKRLRLYSPCYASNMYTIGNIVKVHENGRINYEGQLTTADGCDLQAEQALLASLRLEDIARRQQQQMKPEGEGQSHEEDEEEMDQALQALLEAETAGNDDEEDGEEEGDGSESEEEEKEGEHAEVAALRRVLTNTQDHQSHTTSSNNNNKRKHADTDSNREQRLRVTAQPSNFSRVDPALDPVHLQSRFPLFSQCVCAEVTLKAGQALYLPAGWFHEVQSRNATDGSHLALNYWFHPPSHPIHTTTTAHNSTNSTDTTNHCSDYKQPYSSSFWARDMAARGLESWHRGIDSGRSSY